MSFVFRGSRGDIESGFPEYVPERTTLVCLLTHMDISLCANFSPSGSDHAHGCFDHSSFLLSISVFIQLGQLVATRWLFSSLVISNFYS